MVTTRSAKPENPVINESGESKDPTSNKSTPKRRLAEQCSEKQTGPAPKKLKKSTDPSSSWRKADEIAILEGMQDFTAKRKAAKKKSNPMADMEGFVDFIKDQLHMVDVNKNQLHDKIMKLKDKFEKNKISGKKLVKPHKKKVHELSDQIWGKEIVAKSKTVVPSSSKVKVKDIENEKKEKEIMTGVTENEKREKKEMVNGVTENEKREKKNEKKEMMNAVTENEKNVVGVIHENCSIYDVNERVFRIGSDVFKGEEGGVNEWSKLLMEEIEINIKQLDVQRARTNLVLNVFKSPESLIRR